MSRPPLLVRSLVTRRRYLAAAVIFLIGLVPLVLLATGMADPPGAVVVAGLGLLAGGPMMAANAFLGYPRLLLSAQQLTIWNNPFWPVRHELTGYGPAYGVLHYVRGMPQTVLAFRAAEDEARHRAEEKFAFAPDYGDAALTLPTAHFVGADVEKTEALAAAINRHRDMPA